MFFSKKITFVPFIDQPTVIDIRKPFLSEIYRYAYLPKYSVEKLESSGIINIGPKLYELAASTMKNIIYQLYQVPAVRKYFGTDFTHHLSIQYDRALGHLRFANIEESENAEQYLKEITLGLAIVLKDFLDYYDFIYIFFQGEDVLFVDKIPKEKNISRSKDHIIWYN